MAASKKRLTGESQSPNAAKKQKQSFVSADTTTDADTAIPPHMTSPDDCPKSKKELRLERKRALKASPLSAPPSDSAVLSPTQRGNLATNNKKQKLQSQQDHSRVQGRKQQQRKAKAEKERRIEARFAEQDRIRRSKAEQQQPRIITEKQQNETKSQPTKIKNAPDNQDLAVFQKVFQKTQDPTTGATTCRLGVQYVDETVGKGELAVRPKCLVTVKYQLRGKSRHGVVLDSSKKFTFRVGKGEVIQGWDIGLEGMRVGGVRHLIVPPKAGYGSQDIGAGSGAVLHFTVTLLDIRG
jgi:FKBP-type peptidyl-prolyl cis-trans isomerase